MAKQQQERRILARERFEVDDRTRGAQRRAQPVNAMGSVSRYVANSPHWNAGQAWMNVSSALGGMLNALQKQADEAKDEEKHQRRRAEAKADREEAEAARDARNMEAALETLHGYQAITSAGRDFRLAIDTGQITSHEQIDERLGALAAQAPRNPSAYMNYMQRLGTFGDSLYGRFDDKLEKARLSHLRGEMAKTLGVAVEGLPNISDDDFMEGFEGSRKYYLESGGTVEEHSNLAIDMLANAASGNAGADSGDRYLAALLNLREAGKLLPGDMEHAAKLAEIQTKYNDEALRRQETQRQAIKQREAENHQRSRDAWWGEFIKASPEKRETLLSDLRGRTPEENEGVHGLGWSKLLQDAQNFDDGARRKITDEEERVSDDRVLELMNGWRAGVRFTSEDVRGDSALTTAGKLKADAFLEQKNSAEEKFLTKNLDAAKNEFLIRVPTDIGLIEGVTEYAEDRKIIQPTPEFERYAIAHIRKGVWSAYRYVDPGDETAMAERDIAVKIAIDNAVDDTLSPDFLSKYVPPEKREKRETNRDLMNKLFGHGNDLESFNVKEWNALPAETKKSLEPDFHLREARLRERHTREASNARSVPDLRDTLLREAQWYDEQLRINDELQRTLNTPPPLSAEAQGAKKAAPQDMGLPAKDLWRGTRMSEK